MGSEQKNALLAVILSGLILFGWQYYFSPPKTTTFAPIEPAQVAENKDVASGVGDESSKVAPIEPVTTESYFVTNDKYNIEFDNFLTVINLTNPQAAFSFEDTVESKSSMKVEFDFGTGFTSLPFVKTNAPSKYYNASNDLTAQVVLTDMGYPSFKLTSSKPFKYKFIFSTSSKKLENTQERVFAYFTDELEHLKIGEDESGDKAIKWAGIDFNYHLFAAFFDKTHDLLYKSSANNTFSTFSNTASKELTYNLAFVKKEYNYLATLGHNLNNSVDFGVWGFFAVWILRGLQFFYKFLPNYGLSIILLTMLVRLLTFPLQYKSFVSMKKLQLIQPELNKIREKFKADPQRMQKESMELFKKSGANPLGGCLPLLLQMPVFFAFYKVLHSAVELVDAPFMLWISDLSNKDPYYVLPVLMTLAMFLQQKLTPNTVTDPAQKKMMTFMPLIFGFIMKDLPSGLSLYIFVSTLFGIIQQALVFNSKKTNQPVVV